jgi:hypothetical protein
MTRKRRALPTTLTEESAIAAAAMIGESRIPKWGASLTPSPAMATIPYRRLAGGHMSLAEALAQRGDADFDFDPPRLGGGIFKPAVLD